MVKVKEHPNFSLESIWNAYTRAKSQNHSEICFSARTDAKGDEDARDTSWGVVSPFWAPNSKPHASSQKAGACIGRGFLNSRWYDGSRGQFLSQDPTHLSIGSPRQVQSVTGKSQEYFLTDPQQLNSYSYARNNPITYSDPNGNCPWCLPFLVGGVAGGVGQYVGDIMANRAAGITGVAAFAPRSSWQEYNAAVAFGAGAAATAVFTLPGAALVSMLGSGVGDVAGGRDVSGGKAALSGLVTLGTGGLFRWGVGPSPAGSYMDATGRAFSNLPSTVLRNEFRYVTSGEIFGSSVNAIIQTRFQQAQSYNSSLSSISGSGGSSLSGSHWVTPSGAVVTWEGQMIAGPVAQSTPATITK